MEDRKGSVLRIILTIIVNFIVMFTILLLIKLTNTIELVKTNHNFLSLMNTILGIAATMATILMFRFLDKRDIRELGFKFNKRDFIFFLAVIAFNFIVAFVFLWILEKIGILVVMPSSAIRYDLFMILSSIWGFVSWIIAALQEETIYRGYLMANLKNMSKLKVLIITSFIFTLVHIPFRGFHLYDLAGHFVSGLLLGYIYMKTKSICVSTVVHGVHNFISDFIIIPLHGYSIFQFQGTISPGVKLIYEIVLSIIIFILAESYYNKILPKIDSIITI